jgi:RNA polymerase sigma-70 factor, ECF subfamily
MQNSADQIVDELLVMDAQSGRREAFEALVSRWQKRLWWHARNLTGRSDAAWDVTQESWLHIVRGLGRLKDPAKFGGWAYRIVSNKSCDWLSRNGRDPSLEAESEEVPPPDSEHRPQETAGDVHGILRLLPTRSQLVLNLYYLEGFSLGEIAGILGTPEGTVKSRLHTARIEFRRFWESLGTISLAPIPASGKDKHHE